jgi:hypothetical protein
MHRSALTETDRGIDNYTYPLHPGHSSTPKELRDMTSQHKTTLATINTSEVNNQEIDKWRTVFHSYNTRSDPASIRTKYFASVNIKTKNSDKLNHKQQKDF